MKWLSLISLILCPYPSNAATVTAALSIFQVHSHVNGGVSGGTGFVTLAASGDPLVITNAHVCENRTKMDIYNEYLDTDFEGIKIIKQDRTSDLCALSVPYQSKPFILTTVEVQIGQKVAVLGHPDLGPLSTTRGKINTINIFEFSTSARVEPGSSGSPVFDVYGYVVGIIYHRWNENGHGIAIQIQNLKAFLSNL